ncbi:MAG: hypothetical protein WCL70_04110 [Paludibacter sp.]
MKKLILKWISGAVIVIAGMLFFSLGTSQLNSCSDKSSEKNTAQTTLSLYKASIIDSIHTADKLKENARIDSTKAVERQKSIKATQTAQYWNKVAEKRGQSADYYKFKADSLANINTDIGCREIVGAYKQAIDTLTSQNTALEAENKALDDEAESYSRQLFMCEKQSSNKDVIITSKDSLSVLKDNSISAYQKQLATKNNWFHRAEKWIFGISGMVIGILATK